MNVDKIKKSSIALIKMLDLVAKKQRNALLIVAFREESGAVWSGFPQRRQLLERLLRSGGMPVGILTIKLDDHGFHYFYHRLDECFQMPWAEPFMLAFMNHIYNAKRDEYLTVGIKSCLTTKRTHRVGCADRVAPDHRPEGFGELTGGLAEADALMGEDDMHYYDLRRNWTRKIVPHLNDETLNTILVRDFNNYCVDRWNETFKPGQLPEDVESGDWRLDSCSRGAKPRYWAYVASGACHWIVNFSLCLASLAEPNHVWRIVSSDYHSTVWDGRKTLFDFNYQALGSTATETWHLARYGKNCQIFMPGEQCIQEDPLPWFRNGKRLRINTRPTLDEIIRRDEQRENAR